MAPTRSGKSSQKRSTKPTTKRTRRAKTLPPPPPEPITLPPLPPLSLPQEDLPTVAVKVLPYPAIKHERGQTWIADERPSAQLQKGSRITICTDAQTSGIGRLSGITDLRRHWVTFAIVGTPQQNNLRVPIPWAALDGLESFTHQKHYFVLPSDPPPHRSYADIAVFCDDNENPYEFDIDEDDVPGFSRRIANIVHTYWGNLERDGQRARLVR
ncbi:uncharacterized protein C8Q71DRAFT_870101 [Rhodofomes roseus]|uniref:Uncharacterized protein n=1 Tax=Rhodofomes roseus TaxID=34475 RepID=A0ABQ8KE53_9APHY|nr:uncharacterized protein C8Q71DRAFT_870101 [Rhodofomes roseus]KAH9835831.1 hypothetical protein C8Q71DRAFT_870101 [Rhodofomes roseus]